MSARDVPCVLCGGALGVVHDRAGPWVCPGQVLLSVHVGGAEGPRLVHLWAHEGCVRDPARGGALGGAVVAGMGPAPGAEGPATDGAELLRWMDSLLRGGR